MYSLQLKSLSLKTLKYKYKIKYIKSDTETSTTNEHEQRKNESGVLCNILVKKNNILLSFVAITFDSLQFS